MEHKIRVQVKELGAGSFGTCKLAIDHDGEYVAVKFIPRGRKVCFPLHILVRRGLMQGCLHNAPSITVDSITLIEFGGYFLADCVIYSVLRGRSRCESVACASPTVNSAQQGLQGTCDRVIGRLKRTA